MIEKPIADTIKGALRIEEMTKNCNARVLVGHHRRHNPIVLKTRELVRESVLGIHESSLNGTPINPLIL